jgi:hypothetical protein
VIVDTALNAWYIDSNGRVLPRGNIAPGDRPDRSVSYTHETPEPSEGDESNNA